MGRRRGGGERWWCFFFLLVFQPPLLPPSPSPVRFLQRPLAAVISTLRAPKSAEGYQAIGGGSPLLRITRDQAAALRAALADRGVDANVYVGMRYWKPFTEDAVAALRADGVTDLIVLPLYPQFSISTSGSSLRLLEDMMDADPGLASLRHAVVPSWYWRDGYLDALASLIDADLARFPDPASVEIFFSAHGVPVSYVNDGDPYQAEMEDCVRLVMDRVRARGRSNHHTLAYQSRVGPVEWLTPYTDVKIRELGAAGVKSLLAVPISFVSEHIETLEEMDCEYRTTALESGIVHWGRVPALNTDARFIGDLADLVLEKLPACAPRPGWGASTAPGEAASLGPPTGTVQALLKTYDRERRPLPMPKIEFEPGWTKSAETWNGRIAMVIVFAVLVLEIVTGDGVVPRLMRGF